jgi:hypothetical protein
MADICVLGYWWHKGSLSVGQWMRGDYDVPNFARAARLRTVPLEQPVNLQLAVVGSRSIVNYGTSGLLKFGEFISNKYFDITNINYYDIILGTPFLTKWGISLDFGS